MVNASPPTGLPHEAVGLVVWHSKSGEGYWNPDRGEIGLLPEGWDLLTPGDAAVTRRVKQGPHWILMEKKGEAWGFHSVRVGILAPRAAISAAHEVLGGAQAVEQRKQRKKAAVAKREAQFDAAFEKTIRRNYPGLPPADLPEVVARARSQGHVGRSADWYFAPGAQRDEILAGLVDLAVRAHARHQYTDYEKQLEPYPTGEIEDEEDEESLLPREPLDKETYREVKRCAMEEAEPIVEGWRHPPADEPGE